MRPAEEGLLLLCCALGTQDVPLTPAQYLPISARRKTDALASAEQLGLLARHIETTLLDLAHELRGGSITADPYFRSGQDTACTHCDYLTVCHFTPGAGGDCHRVLTKLPADKVWSNLKGGAADA